VDSIDDVRFRLATATVVSGWGEDDSFFLALIFGIGDAMASAARSRA